MITRLFDNLTRLSIRFRWIVFVISLLVLVSGTYAVTTLNLELLPRIEFPQTIIVTQWQDAESAEQFLAEVTTPLENAISGVDGVVNRESTTTKSFAFIIVRNDFGENQERITSDIRDAISNVNLPEGVEITETIREKMDVPNIIEIENIFNPV